MPVNKIVIGVSSCLLGHKVRYDGNDKWNSIVDNLCNHFDCRAICPEYAIGLGVPRSPIQIYQTTKGMRAVGTTDITNDITDALVHYADFVCYVLPQISGYVFKSRSPSCGLSDTPIYDRRHTKQMAVGRGVFTGRLCEIKHSLPVIDEIQLRDQEKRRKFIQDVELFSQALKHQ